MHHTAARSTLHARTVQLTIALGVALLVTPLNAAAQPRDAFNGGPITGPRARSIECNGGRFLTGVTEQLTDRIVGIGFTCYPATSAQRWVVDDGAFDFGFGDLRSGTSRTKNCPTDYFIVGLAARFGTYAADSHGLAQARPSAILADLMPVCTDAAGTIYALQASQLTEAENNDVHEVSSDAIGGRRSCGRGKAAVKITFWYDGRRDIDPANVFADASLTCRRLPLTMKTRPRHPPD